MCHSPFAAAAQRNFSNVVSVNNAVVRDPFATDFLLHQCQNHQGQNLHFERDVCRLFLDLVQILLGQLRHTCPLLASALHSSNTEIKNDICHVQESVKFHQLHPHPRCSCDHFEHEVHGAPLLSFGLADVAFCHFGVIWSLGFPL